MFGEVRVPHTGNIVDKVIEASYQIMSQGPAIAESVNAMKALPLAEPEQQIFAEAALTVRYPNAKAPVTADQVLTPRRRDDGGNDLWQVTNRLQENLVRGGLTGTAARGRRTRTRQVEGIDQNTGLNRALWQLAERMKEIKSA